MNIQIKDEIHQRLKMQAAARNEKIHELTEKAILKYLEELEKTPERKTLI